MQQRDGQTDRRTDERTDTGLHVIKLIDLITLQYLTEVLVGLKLAVTIYETILRDLSCSSL
jgi:hypothetical protein